MDLAPDQDRDPVQSSSDSLLALRNAVRRDLEALLNTRRRWRSWPSSLGELAQSPIGFGVPDFSSGSFGDLRQRDWLRLEIAETIRRFEPRFLSVSVTLQPPATPHEPSLRLRIDAVLHAEPAPEPMSFDTVIDPASDDVTLVARDTV